MKPAAPVALVSGASGGLGRAIAVGLGRAGYRVGVHYHLNKAAADRVCQAIRRAGGDAAAEPADLAERASVEQLVAGLERRWRRIDLLVHAAGSLRDGLALRLTPADWRQVIDTHLTGGFHLVQLVGRVMAGQRRGQMVLIGSIAGVSGRAGQANYAAAKAGLIALTKVAAREWGRDQIQVNCLLPGHLAAGMGQRISAAQRARLTRDMLIRRPAEAGAVADWIVALARTRQISGQVINLDSRLIES
jgi:3-oxoacyl-[acyl-carrier protein] reductase